VTVHKRYLQHTVHCSVKTASSINTWIITGY